MKLTVDIYKKNTNWNWKIVDGETGDGYENSRGTTKSVEDALKLSRSWISDNLNIDEVDGIGFDIDHTDVNFEDVEESIKVEDGEVIIFTSVHKRNKFKSWDEYIKSHKK